MLKGKNKIRWRGVPFCWQSHQIKWLNARALASRWRINIHILFFTWYYFKIQKVKSIHTELFYYLESNFPRKAKGQKCWTWFIFSTEWQVLFVQSTVWRRHSSQDLDGLPLRGECDEMTMKPVPVHYSDNLVLKLEIPNICLQPYNEKCGRKNWPKTNYWNSK